MTVANQLAFDILARDKASKTFDKIGNKAKTTESTISKVGSGIAKAAGVIALGGVAALGAGFVQGAKDAASYEVLAKKTQAVIASTGNVARISVGGVQTLAGNLESLSGVDEELIINSQNVLATFTKVRNEVGKGNEIFNRGTEAALNMSVALGQDLQSATLQVGKALNDPIRGVTALRRAGVQLTTQQEEQIRTMVESGDVLGAQKIILGELETQFGGVAEAAGDTLTGDVARAQDALADMGREVGEAVLPAVGAFAEFISEDAVPAVENIVDVGGEMLDMFRDLPGPVQAGVLAIGGIATSAPLIIGGAKKIRGAIDGVRDSYKAMGRVQKAATLSLGVVGVGLAAGAAVLGHFAQKNVEAEQRVDELAGSLDQQTGALTDNTRQVVINNLEKDDLLAKAEALGVNTEDFVDAILGEEDALARVNQQLEGAADGNTELARLARESGVGMDILQDATKDVQGALRSNSDEVKAATEQEERRRRALGETATEQEGVTEATEIATDAAEDNADAIGEQVSAVEELVGQLDDLSGRVLSQRDAQRNLEEAVDQASQSLKDNGATLDITTEKGRKNQEALDDIADSTFDLIDAMARNGASNEQLVEKMSAARTEFVKTAIQMGMTEENANKLADQLGLIPGNYKATITAEDDATYVIEGVRTKLNGIDGKIVTTYLDTVERVRATGRDPYIRNPNGGLTRVNAKGTDYFEGGLTWVGEEGPELLNLPRGSQIFSNPKSMAMVRAANRAGSGGGRMVPVGGSSSMELRATGDDSGVVTFLLGLIRKGQLRLAVNGQPVKVA